MLDVWASLLWSIALLVALWWASRRLAYYFTGSVILLANNPTAAASLYAIFILPGTVIHELSHWLMAKLVGVRTGHVNIMPKLQRDGTIRLGFVEIRGGSLLQHTLIGLAPLVVGSILTVWLSFSLVDIEGFSRSVEAGYMAGVLATLRASLQKTDVFLALYLLFTVSDAMFLSDSDRAPIQRTLLYMGLILLPLYVLGILPALPESWTTTLQQGFEAYAYGLGIALLVHLGLVVACALIFYLLRSLPRN
ncbi:MAG: hypothetical protein GY759_11165 [Chloroflexi bacterium]|nr:hypothetical protein [Chloroflexota bacterium]